MTSAASTLFAHRELIAALAWKNVAVRYKQAYFGLAWTVAKPIMMMLIFSLMRSFIGIDSGGIPYPVLAYCALLPWTFFQESVSEGVQSVVGNAHLIKKVYFPREIFPLTAVLTKVVELAINFLILACLMGYYGLAPGVQAVWVPLLVIYTVCAAMTVALLGAAINVYFRDIGQMLPVLLNLLMYVSPVIYPLSLVRERLLVEHAVGAYSELIYLAFTVNPIAGIIDAFQHVLLQGLAPDIRSMLPGVILVLICLPISYKIFKRAESHFADVI